MQNKNRTVGSLQHEEVELRAYQLWQDRGEPFGTPDVDWFRAEHELISNDPEPKPVLLEVAQVIGAALGSVTALVSGNR